jgi:endonuclease/exonuclease/phosphatase family metal-dependent hydrolase
VASAGVYVGIGVRLRVLTWNLMHGRAVGGQGADAPERFGRDLIAEFSDALEGWEWDVALLQEVPPWWPAMLARRLDAEYRMVLTSRNGLLAVRRAIAIRWPDLIKSNGGGANAILVRHDRIVSHCTQRLCRWPERRWVHGVQLASGVWLANLHATAHDTDAAWRDGRAAAATSHRWAAGNPLVLGGDFNLREPAFDGMARVASRDVDHLFVAGLEGDGEAEVLERDVLSDHPPLVASTTATA